MADPSPDDLTLAINGARRIVDTLATHRAALEGRPFARLNDDDLHRGQVALDRAQRAADAVLANLKAHGVRNPRTG